MQWQNRTSRRYLMSELLLLLAPFAAGRSMSQTPNVLVVPKNAVAGLEHFAAEPKFLPDGSGLYTGIRTETDRQAAETAINGLALRLSHGIAANPTKVFVLDEIASTLPAFEELHSEDKDRALEYIEQVMDAVGLESSDGLLNRWRYGFDPSEK
jgi:hypothetical protein